VSCRRRGVHQGLRKGGSVGGVDCPNTSRTRVRWKGGWWKGWRARYVGRNGDGIGLFTRLLI